MLVIMAYDVGKDRLAKMLKKCRSYLHWVQNSVFEGDLSEAGLSRLKHDIESIIDPRGDSVVLYTFRTARYSSREILGIEKGGPTTVL